MTGEPVTSWPSPDTPEPLATVTIDKDAPEPRVVCGVCAEPYEQRRNILKPDDPVEDWPWFPSCKHSTRDARFETTEAGS